ncbi:unnamed protein product [Sphagnum balticum]
MALSNGTKRRMVIALADRNAGNEVIGAVGLYGGFRIGASAAVASSSGDCQAVPDSGGAPGTYRVMFPAVNAQIQSIDWLNVSGFTPRNPTAAETAAALVTGFNFDPSLKQWYITVQIVGIDSQAVLSSPPVGFTIGVRASVTLLQSANAL